MKFAKKKLACLNCKAPIASGSLCAHCSPKVCLIMPHQVKAHVCIKCFIIDLTRHMTALLLRFLASIWCTPGLLYLHTPIFEARSCWP
jgi:hypothetical protein